MRKDIGDMSIDEFERFKGSRNANRSRRLRLGLARGKVKRGITNAAINEGRDRVIITRAERYLENKNYEEYQVCLKCGQNKSILEAEFEVAGFGFRNVCRACDWKRMREYHRNEVKS